MIGAKVTIHRCSSKKIRAGYQTLADNLLCMYGFAGNVPILERHNTNFD